MWHIKAILHFWLSNEIQIFWYSQLHCTVHGVEYAFGAHDYPTSGVFEVEPRQCPGFKFRKSIFIGTTSLDPIQVREFMERHSASYNGDTYHLIAKNCNHFCKDICSTLTGKPIPKWVNRLAKIGTLFLSHYMPHWYSNWFFILLAQKFTTNFIFKHFGSKLLQSNQEVIDCHKICFIKVLMKDLPSITDSHDFAI